MRREFSKKNLDIFTSSDKLVELFVSDEKLLPYIGKFLVQIVTTHHKDYIRRDNPYQQVYEEKLRQYVEIVKKSPEVASSSKMIRMYQLAPCLYLRYTFPIVNRTWRNLNRIIELFRKRD